MLKKKKKKSISTRWTQERDIGESSSLSKFYAKKKKKRMKSQHNFQTLQYLSLSS